MDFRAPKDSEPAGWARFSFWKPEPVPPKDCKVLSVDLRSLGGLSEVAEKLFEVPKMEQLPANPWELLDKAPTLRMRWEVEEGVLLKVRPEQGPPKPGEVLTIEAHSAAPNRIFYRLYVQLYEQFGVTLLDERSHDFLSPREFRAQAG